MLNIIIQYNENIYNSFQLIIGNYFIFLLFAIKFIKFLCIFKYVFLFHLNLKYDAANTYISFLIDIVIIKHSLSVK